MAEILVKAVSASHADPETDQKFCYKRGMPVMVRPDGYEWGQLEGPPKFFLLKIPGVPVSSVEKFVATDTDPDANEPGGHVIVRRRLWMLRADDLPAAAKTKLQQQGFLTISPTGDYTWAQVKGFFQNLRTGAALTEDL